ncbi:ribbon-helix-helix protein, CopG family [Mesorhizobium xinjiangense]|uniref:ribbon-helix-helix protein, CopG family n=1 Tax=Mesorhizobium xinjiangense TaxID=2678685 RepID=UPI0018DE61C6|nr:ribbon-helix-helix protein, CopG family [Mesorhizobium xinjiangense]
MGVAQGGKQIRVVVHECSVPVESPPILPWKAAGRVSVLFVFASIKHPATRFNRRVSRRKVMWPVPGFGCVQDKMSYMWYMQDADKAEPAMSYLRREHKGESVTFRIDPKAKEELVRLAETDHKSLGELMRELAEERLARERRRAFEAEARRQSMEAAAAAGDQKSDEHAVMRELEADLDAFDDEWK